MLNICLDLCPTNWLRLHRTNVPYCGGQSVIFQTDCNSQVRKPAN